MPLPIAPILGILADNLRKRGSVLPLSRRSTTRWAKGMNLPRGGATVLYTGHMYQLIPAIDAMATQMAALENSPLTKFFGLGRFANRFVNLSFFMSLVASKEKKAENDRILKHIAMLLKNAGVEFGYLYGKELYSGALAYDEGLDEVFEGHARRVFRLFRDNGVRQVITVDPHTTNMLREVYPAVITEFDIKVRSYLEVLAERAPAALHRSGRDVVIHDSCVYARYENMIDPPRLLLKGMGATILAPELSGKATHCCGGPIESLFPGKAHKIAKTRVEQLAAAGQDVVTMCPICLVNLRKAADRKVRLTDVSTLLVEGYCD